MRTEQAYVSTAINNASQLFIKVKQGNFTFVSLNKTLWDNILLMSHDLAGTKIKDMDKEAAIKTAIKATEAVFHAMYREIKGNTRQKIFLYILANPSCPAGIHKHIDVEQSVCSAQMRVLERAGIIISHRSKGQHRVLEKTVNHQLMEKLEKYVPIFSGITHIIHLSDETTLSIVAPEGVGPVLSAGHTYLVGKTVNIERLKLKKPFVYSSDGTETHSKFLTEGIEAAL